jgi:hypothetical protein
MARNARIKIQVLHKSGYAETMTLTPGPVMVIPGEHMNRIVDPRTQMEYFWNHDGTYDGWETTSTPEEAARFIQAHGKTATTEEGEQFFAHAKKKVN